MPTASEYAKMVPQTLEELREMLELTDTIAANLKTIADAETGGDGLDLDGLADQTTTIIANLQAIEVETGSADLEEMVEQTTTIVANLKTIEDHDLK